MGTIYDVVDHALVFKPAVEVISALRSAIQVQIDDVPERPEYCSESDWNAHRERLNAERQNWFAQSDSDFLECVAGNERWYARIESDGTIYVEPPRDVSGGIDYDWLNLIPSFVSGYIQIQVEDRVWRVVWKDGKKSRRVDPVWPEPDDED